MTEDQERETARVRAIFDRLARSYDLAMGLAEWPLLGRRARRRVARRARGATVELACGTGLNLRHYPREVDLVGLELSPAMLARANARTRALPPGRGPERVALAEGDAAQPALPDHRFDSAVVTLAFCTFPDPDRVASELRRLLRPGASLEGLEHVRSPSPWVAWVQDRLTPMAVRRGADWLNRDTLALLRRHGFAVTVHHRRWWGTVVEYSARTPAPPAEDG